MHISNVEARFNSHDIMSIIKDFVKVDNLNITNITLDRNIIIQGSFKAVFKLNFLIAAELQEAKGKIVKLKISSIKINRIGVFSIIKNMALKVALKKLNKEGIDFSEKAIVLNLDMLLKNVPYISFDISDLNILTDEAVAKIENISIGIDKLLNKEDSDKPQKETPHNSSLQGEIEDSSDEEGNNTNKGGFEAQEGDLNRQEASEKAEVIEEAKAQDYYTNIRKGVSQKIPKKYEQYLLILPDLVALILRMFKDKRVPIKTKIVLGISSAYISLPFDFIPDNIPFLGRLEELGVAMFALTRIIEDVPKEVILSNWEGDKDILETIETVLLYLKNFTSGAKIDKVYNFMDDIISV